MPTATKRYRMPHSVFLRKMFLLYGKIWIAVLAAGVLVFALLGIFVDIRLAVLSLMILFIVAPMVVSMLYYYVGMRRDCAMNVIDHRLFFSPEGILMEVFRSPATPEDASDGKTEEDSDVKKKETEESYFVKYGREDIGKMIFGLNDAVVIVGGGKGFLWLPLSAFESEEDFSKAAEMIRKPDISK